jgi:rRNA-processing protein FCF1
VGSACFGGALDQLGGSFSEVVEEDQWSEDNRRMVPQVSPEPYLARVRRDLATLGDELQATIDSSTIKYINPNSGGGGVFFVGASDYGWGPSDDALTAARMALLSKYSDWYDRFLLLFPNPTPEVRSKIKKADDFVRQWVGREGAFDHAVPRTVEEAKKVAAARWAAFDDLLDVAGMAGDKTLRLLPDTSALLRNPAVEEYGSAVGSSSYMVHIVTTVLGELDDLKDRGRTPDVREKAYKVVRRLKGLRDRGSLADGVTVAGQVRLRLEHREVDARSVLSWLDPAVPDDRILGAALRLQSDHPAGVVVLITGDLNLQNKADAVGLPYADPPAPIGGS